MKKGSLRKICRLNTNILHEKKTLEEVLFLSFLSTYCTKINLQGTKCNVL
jgi:hypothetical protein